MWNLSRVLFPECYMLLFWQCAEPTSYNTTGSSGRARPQQSFWLPMIAVRYADGLRVSIPYVRSAEERRGKPHTLLVPGFPIGPDELRKQDQVNTLEVRQDVKHTTWRGGQYEDSSVF